MEKRVSVIRSTFFVVLVILFFLYVRDCIVYVSYDGNDVAGSPFNIYYVLGLTAISLFYFIIKRNILVLRYEISVYAFTLFICLIAIYHSIFTSPIGGISGYLLLFPPFLLFSYVGNYVASSPDNKTHIIASVVLFFSVAVVFVLSFQKLSILLNVELHNIYAYVVLLLLPTVLCSTNKSVRIASIIVTGVIMMISFKRGGLVAYAVGFLFYLHHSYKSRFKTNKLLRNVSYLLIIGAMVYGLAKIDDITDNIMRERFMLNNSDDITSGRGDIYRTTFQMITSSDLSGIVLGHGYNAVVKDSRMEMAAHNDFLEVMYDYGIFGLVLMLIMCFLMIKRAIFLAKIKNPYSAAFTYAVIIFLVLSAVSTLVRIPVLSMCMYYTFGYLCGKTRKQKYQ